MWLELFNRLLSLFTWVVMVAPWEQALRVRLGKHVKLLHTGMHLRVPVVDQVFRQPTRQRRCVLPPQVLTTADDVSLTLGAAIGYGIADLEKLYRSIHDAQDTIETDVAATITTYVTAHMAAECLPHILAPAVQSQLRLGRWGLSNVEVSVCSYVRAPTIRLITGNLNEGSAQWLSTSNEGDSEGG